MFEQLGNELGVLWTACITYPFTVTLAISVTLNLVLGYMYLKLKYDFNFEYVSLVLQNKAYEKENSELREKLKKYEKVKKPLTETKHEIKSKLKELK